MTTEVEPLGNYCVTFHALCHSAMTTLVIALSLNCKFFLSLSEVFILEKQITPNAIEISL